MDLWIIGGGGAALELRAVALAMAVEGGTPWHLRGFVVPDGRIDFDPEGLEIRAESTFLSDGCAAPGCVVVAVGDPELRARLVATYMNHHFPFATLIHPRAVVGPAVVLGEGSVLMANAVVETNAVVGAHSLINVGATIAHNCVLGDCCNLGPGVHMAGWAMLGDRCDLGVGACLRPRVVLAKNTVVGAGAAVVKSWIEPGLTLVGVPARPLTAPPIS